MSPGKSLSQLHVILITRKLSVLETIECGIIAMPPKSLLCVMHSPHSTSTRLRTPNNKIHHINLNCNNFAYCSLELAGWLEPTQNPLEFAQYPSAASYSRILYSLFSICRLPRHTLPHPTPLTFVFGVCLFAVDRLPHMHSSHHDCDVV